MAGSFKASGFAFSYVGDSKVLKSRLAWVLTTDRNDEVGLGGTELEVRKDCPYLSRNQRRDETGEQYLKESNILIR